MNYGFEKGYTLRKDTVIFIHFFLGKKRLAIRRYPLAGYVARALIGIRASFKACKDNLIFFKDACKVTKGQRPYYYALQEHFYNPEYPFGAILF